MPISVQMTIKSILGFHHAHLCTNDDPYYYGFFVMHISVRMTIHILMGFRHAHICTNDYPYSYGFLSCTYLHKRLSILLWVSVMRIFVWMTIHILMGFHHVHPCVNDYLVPNFFPMRFCKTGIFLCLHDFLAGINRWGRAQWCLSSNGEFLGVFNSNVLVSPSAKRSPTRE